MIFCKGSVVPTEEIPIVVGDSEEVINHRWLIWVLRLNVLCHVKAIEIEIDEGGDFLGSAWKVEGPDGVDPCCLES